MTESQIKIIEAAYPMFMEHGYKGTTTSEISKVAGINESTIFRNFKNDVLKLNVVMHQKLVGSCNKI